MFLFRHFLLYKKLKLKISTSKISACCFSLLFGLCAVKHCIRLTAGILKAWQLAMFKANKIPCRENKNRLFTFPKLVFSRLQFFSPIKLICGKFHLISFHISCIVIHTRAMAYNRRTAMYTSKNVWCWWLIKASNGDHF